MDKLEDLRDKLVNIIDKKLSEGLEPTKIYLVVIKVMEQFYERFILGLDDNYEYRTEEIIKEVKKMRKEFEEKKKQEGVYIG